MASLALEKIFFEKIKDEQIFISVRLSRNRNELSNCRVPIDCVMNLYDLSVDFVD